jgi:hypothetical protein
MTGPLGSPSVGIFAICAEGAASTIPVRSRALAQRQDRESADFLGQLKPNIEPLAHGDVKRSACEGNDILTIYGDQLAA